MTYAVRLNNNNSLKIIKKKTDPNAKLIIDNYLFGHGIIYDSFGNDITSEEHDSVMEILQQYAPSVYLEVTK